MRRLNLMNNRSILRLSYNNFVKLAQWRRLQGISMEGDEELLAVEKEPLKRDEWMTALPTERKPGVTTQSTRAFSRTTEEGRGDTSARTDSPLDKAQKSKAELFGGLRQNESTCRHRREKEEFRC